MKEADNLTKIGETKDLPTFCVAQL